MRDWTNKTHVGDCRTLLQEMAAEGVCAQMCVTSPPYFGLRDYGVAGQIGLEPTPAEYIEQIVTVFRAVREVLTEDGTLWLNIGDSYNNSDKWGGGAANTGKHMRATGDNPSTGVRRRWHGMEGCKPKDLLGIPWMVAFALRQDGWYLRSDIIWHKPNPMPESVRDRPTKAHDYVFLLSKSERYYYDAEAITEECSQDTHERYAALKGKEFGTTNWTRGEGPHDSVARSRNGGVGRNARPRKAAPNGAGIKNNQDFDKAMAVMPERRNKRTVWTIPTEAFSAAHFATFPRALIEPCILAGARPGNTVLDPFMGSGTTGQVATDLGRNFIGCELNPEYVELHEMRRTTIGMPI